MMRNLEIENINIEKFELFNRRFVGKYEREKGVLITKGKIVNSSIDLEKAIILCHGETNSRVSDVVVKSNFNAMSLTELMGLLVLSYPSAMRARANGRSHLWHIYGPPGSGKSYNMLYLSKTLNNMYMYVAMSVLLYIDESVIERNLEQMTQIHFDFIFQDLGVKVDWNCYAKQFIAAAFDLMESESAPKFETLRNVPNMNEVRSTLTEQLKAPVTSGTDARGLVIGSVKTNGAVVFDDAFSLSHPEEVYPNADIISQFGDLGGSRSPMVIFTHNLDPSYLSADQKTFGGNLHGIRARRGILLGVGVKDTVFVSKTLFFDKKMLDDFILLLFCYYVATHSDMDSDFIRFIKSPIDKIMIINLKNTIDKLNKKTNNVFGNILKDVVHLNYKKLVSVNNKNMLMFVGFHYILGILLSKNILHFEEAELLLCELYDQAYQAYCTLSFDTNIRSLKMLFNKFNKEWYLKVFHNNNQLELYNNNFSVNEVKTNGVDYLERYFRDCISNEYNVFKNKIGDIFLLKFYELLSFYKKYTIDKDKYFQSMMEFIYSVNSNEFFSIESSCQSSDLCVDTLQGKYIVVRPELFKDNRMIQQFVDVIYSSFEFLSKQNASLINRNFVLNAFGFNIVSFLLLKAYKLFYIIETQLKDFESIFSYPDFQLPRQKEKLEYYVPTVAEILSVWSETGDMQVLTTEKLSQTITDLVAHSVSEDWERTVHIDKVLKNFENFCLYFIDEKLAKAVREYIFNNFESTKISEMNTLYNNIYKLVHETSFQAPVIDRETKDKLLSIVKKHCKNCKDYEGYLKEFLFNYEIANDFLRTFNNTRILWKLGLFVN